MKSTTDVALFFVFSIKVVLYGVCSATIDE